MCEKCTGGTTRELLELVAMVQLLMGDCDSELFNKLGLSSRELKRRLKEGDELVGRARLIVLSGSLATKKFISLLLRAGLVDLLTRVEKPAEIRDLATAAARLPDWVLDEAARAENSWRPENDNPNSITGSDSSLVDRNGGPIEPDCTLEQAIEETRRLIDHLSRQSDDPEQPDLPQAAGEPGVRARDG